MHFYLWQISLFKQLSHVWAITSFLCVSDREHGTTEEHSSREPLQHNCAPTSFIRSTLKANVTRHLSGASPSHIYRRNQSTCVRCRGFVGRVIMVCDSVVVLKSHGLPCFETVRRCSSPQVIIIQPIQTPPRPLMECKQMRVSATLRASK